jgi:[protein-PII] uridylyltransferase
MSHGASLLAATAPVDATRSPSDSLRFFKERLRSGKEALYQHYDQGVPVTRLVQDLSELIDAVLRDVWNLHLGESSEAALVAVGGYGRRELHPASDIDILVLIDSDPAPPPDRVHRTPADTTVGYRA